MLLGEITCWSFLRVKGLNDHSVFSFSSVFERLFHEAQAGSLQLIINTSGYPIVNIPYPPPLRPFHLTEISFHDPLNFNGNHVPVKLIVKG